MAKTAQAVIETKVKDGASAGFRNMQKEMNRTAKQGKVLNQQFRFMRGGLGQVGHQVQDVAVQLQMGQNAMLVFGQQGSQIASLFGPGGAMFGAVIAIGAALSMSLAPAFFGATEAAKELKEANKGLIDSFDELSPAQQKFATLLATKKLEEYEAELKKLNATTREQLTTVRTGSFGIVYGRKDLETLEEYNERITKLDSDTAFYEAAIASLKEQIAGVNDSFAKQDSALQKQIDTYGMSSLQIEEYTIRQQLLREELSQTEALQLLMHVAELKRLGELSDAKDKAAQGSKLADDFAAKSTTGKTEQMLGDAVKLTNGVGKQSKKLAAVQKTVQVGQAIMNTYTAASKAIATYGIPLGIPFAAMAVAQGMAQVSAIKSASFEGGGFTGRGSRSGGVDGKGGFNAILHPNETVIDHTKGGGQGLVVNQTINISTGVQQTVRAEMQNLLPQIQEAAKGAVLAERRRGGGYSTGILGR